MLNKGISALVITPIDAQAIVPAIKRANKMGIPVFCTATSAGGGKIAKTTAMDHTKAGRQAADEIAALLKARFGSAKGTVVEIEGPLTEAAGLQRHQGFAEEIAKYPNIKVVGSQPANFDATQTFNVMSSMITAHPDIDAVMSANNTTTIGVLKALQRAGHLKPVGKPGHVIVVGIDGGPTDWAYLRDGTLDATVAENPLLLAGQTIGYVKAVLAGKTVPANTPQEGLVITKANMNSKAAAGYSWVAAARN